MYSSLLVLATTPAPSPTPSLRPGLSQDQVTPGLLGFLLTAFIVVLTALLIVDMVRRIRRVRYRAQVEEERAAAMAAGSATAAGPAAGEGFPQGSAGPGGPVWDPARKPEDRPDVNGDAEPGHR